MTVHDCFLFFNELDALELRLEELDPVVDRFVLVEATTTFSGKPKPLVFAEHKERFARFLPRITHVVVDDMPQDGDAWAREAHQRDAILRGLEGAAPEDVVLVSDVDEIPRADAVRAFAASGEEVVAFELRFFYYALNCRNIRGTPRNPWNVALRRRALGSPQAARAANLVHRRLADAGWHFSCLGDARAIREKIQAFSHRELDLPQFTDEEEIRRRVRGGLDLFDRPGFEWRFVPLDATFPRHVLEHRERFAHLLVEADEGPRLLLLYNRDPTTTAAYLEAALRRRARVTTAGAGQEVDLPRERVSLPALLDRLGRFDAVLEVQGDSVDVVGQDQVDVPCAWWVIDSHLATSYGYHHFRARAFDHLFVAQKHHVERYRDWAGTKASWLPLAADPAVHRPFDDVTPAYDVGFVGNVLPGLHDARRALLARLLSRFERVAVARGLFLEEAARFVAGCRLAFNRSLHEDVNMRIFELAACGRPVLTDRLPAKCGLGDLFGEGELLLYDDDGVEATVERGLAEPEAAEAAAKAARARVLASHTYDHRAEEVLRVLKAVA